MKKNKNKNQGFSLVEVLIAVAILAAFIIPISMNLISGSRINGRAKKVSTSSNMSTSVIEVMQSVGLGDIMTSVNGFSEDEYGNPIEDVLGNALYGMGYEIESRKETISNDGTFVPVTNGVLDSSTTSSIRSRTTGDVNRRYFVGQPEDANGNENYSFLFTNVKNEDMAVDILATITSEKKYNIVDITSMNHSEVLYVKQPSKRVGDTIESTMDWEAAREFERTSNSFGQGRNADWYYENMQRRISVEIKKDLFSDSVSIVVKATYSCPSDESCGEIVKQVGSFSTNSTSEFARGVHIYYYPLYSNPTIGFDRDNFVVINESEISVPVYFVALADSAASSAITPETNMDTYKEGTQYRPNIEIREKSTDPEKAMRTIVCSNIANEYWAKNRYPNSRKPYDVKTLGNESDRQTLYSVKLQVYNHSDKAFSESGAFTPREKDLLSETNGSFIDTSERFDIGSISVGVGELGSANVVVAKSFVYDGTEKCGTTECTGVVIEGDSEATDAGTYKFIATPETGKCWADGTVDGREFSWVIERAPLPEITPVLEKVYNGQLQSPFEPNVSGVSFNGTREAQVAGQYMVTITPDNNHCWSNGRTNTITYNWTIKRKALTVAWSEPHVWEYDENVNSYSVTASLMGVIDGDQVSFTCVDNVLERVGHKTARVHTTLSGPQGDNYYLDGSTICPITVYSKGTSSVELNGTFVEADENDSVYELVYNGEIQDIINNFENVSIGDIQFGEDVGEYTVSATPLEGCNWGDEWDDGTKYFKWKIVPAPIEINWGKTLGVPVSETDDIAWEYDAYTHSACAWIKEGYDAEGLSIELRNNAVSNIDDGEVEVTAVLVNPDRSINKNYVISNNTKIIRILPSKDAECRINNIVYDGNEHMGVFGNYIELVDDAESSVATDVNVWGTGENRKVIPYLVKVKPIENHSWKEGTRSASIDENTGDVIYADIECGSVETITVAWYMLPVRSAYYDVKSLCEQKTNGELDEQQGVYFYNATHTRGTLKASEKDVYSVYLIPNPNYAWQDTGSDNNPDIRELEIEWEIKEYEPTIEIGGSNPIYNGNAHKPELWCNGELSEWEIKPEWDPEYADTWVDLTDIEGFAALFKNCIDAGYYSLCARYKEKPNDEIWLEWAIDPRPIEIDIQASSESNVFDYDGEEHQGTAVITNLVTNDDCELSYDNNKHTNSGSYYFSIIDVNNDNYTVYDADYNYLYEEAIPMTINPRAVDINWGTKIFQKSSAGSQLSPTLNNVLERDINSLSLSLLDNDKKREVGSYLVTVNCLSGRASSNYRLSDDCEFECYMVVWDKIIKEIDVRLETYYFDGEEHTAKFLINNGYTLVNSETGKYVGSYTAEVQPPPFYFWDGYPENKYPSNTPESQIDISGEVTWKIIKGYVQISVTEDNISVPFQYEIKGVKLDSNVTNLKTYAFTSFDVVGQSVANILSSSQLPSISGLSYEEIAPDIRYIIYKVGDNSQQPRESQNLEGLYVYEPGQYNITIQIHGNENFYDVENEFCVNVEKVDLPQNLTPQLSPYSREDLPDIDSTSISIESLLTEQRNTKLDDLQGVFLGDINSIDNVHALLVPDPKVGEYSYQYLKKNNNNDTWTECATSGPIVDTDAPLVKFGYYKFNWDLTNSDYFNNNSGHVSFQVKYGLLAQARYSHLGQISTVEKFNGNYTIDAENSLHFCSINNNTFNYTSNNLNSFQYIDDLAFYTVSLNSFLNYNFQTTNDRSATTQFGVWKNAWIKNY